MIFYTNVYLQNKSLYCRGYKDGKPFTGTIPFKPSLYRLTNKESKHKTENGKNLQEIKCNNIKHAIHESYNSQVKLYGNKKYEYQFINKAFPGDIKYDTSLIKILTIVFLQTWFDLLISDKWPLCIEPIVGINPMSSKGPNDLINDLLFNKIFICVKVLNK